MKKLNNIQYIQNLIDSIQSEVNKAKSNDGYCSTYYLWTKTNDLNTEILNNEIKNQHNERINQIINQ